MIDHCCNLEQAGAGEILLNSVDNDGMRTGYDLELLEKVLSKIKIPVVVCGGAKDSNCLRAAAQLSADPAAGSLFVFSNKGGGVSVNYPSQNLLDDTL